MNIYIYVYTYIKTNDTKQMHGPTRHCVCALLYNYIQVCLLLLRETVLFDVSRGEIIIPRLHPLSPPAKKDMLLPTSRQPETGCDNSSKTNLKNH